MIKKMNARALDRIRMRIPRGAFMVILLVCVSVSCTRQTLVPHLGHQNQSKKIVGLDSVVVDMDMTSGQGNFFMADSMIQFADMYDCSVFQYHAVTGQFLGKKFGKGNGPNELPALLYAYPFANRAGECFVMDRSMTMYTYNQSDYKLLKRKSLDFGWQNMQRNTYDLPSSYTVMELNDFGIDFSCLNDSIVVIPVNLMNRFFDDIESERYSRGHVLGELNLNTMKVEKVFGRFPEVYKEKPTTYMEFQSLVLREDTLYMNHAIDSLIYVYKYPDTLLYTIGYESPGVNRDYTTGYHVDEARARQDVQKVGVNTGLMYIKESDLLIRTTLKNSQSGVVGMQAYCCHDLVLDVEMPAYFKLLGFRNGHYYGVGMIPAENNQGKILGKFYRFKIE